VAASIGAIQPVVTLHVVEAGLVPSVASAVVQLTLRAHFTGRLIVATQGQGRGRRGQDGAGRRRRRRAASDQLFDVGNSVVYYRCLRRRDLPSIRILRDR